MQPDLKGQVVAMVLAVGAVVAILYLLYVFIHHTQTFGFARGFKYHVSIFGWILGGVAVISTIKTSPIFSVCMSIFLIFTAVWLIGRFEQACKNFKKLYK